RGEDRARGVELEYGRARPRAPEVQPEGHPVVGRDQVLLGLVGGGREVEVVIAQEVETARRACGDTGDPPLPSDQSGGGRVPARIAPGIGTAAGSVAASEDAASETEERGARGGRHGEFERARERGRALTLGRTRGSVDEVVSQGGREGYGKIVVYPRETRVGEGVGRVVARIEKDRIGGRRVLEIKETEKAEAAVDDAEVGIEKPHIERVGIGQGAVGPDDGSLSRRRY